MWAKICMGCAWLLYQLTQLVGDWGLAIIIVTLIIRLILFPLQRKQFKSSFAMQELQPKIKQIQELYANDQQKQAEEMQRIYKETGFNPMAGCLPMLIQMPIFIILFRTLRDYLVDYEGVSFYNILPDLNITVQESGFNIVYIIFAIGFVVFSVAPMVYQYVTNKEQRGQMGMMLVIMAAMFIWMCAISPAGVILYWTVSSLFGFVQQIFTQRSLKKHKAQVQAEELHKPIQVNVQRKPKKSRPHKKH